MATHSPAHGPVNPWPVNNHPGGVPRVNVTVIGALSIEFATDRISFADSPDLHLGPARANRHIGLPMDFRSRGKSQRRALDVGPAVSHSPRHIGLESEGPMLVGGRREI